MRVTAAFNRLLGFPGTVVEKVVFTATQILVTMRQRSRRLRCPCGQVSAVALQLLVDAGADLQRARLLNNRIPLRRIVGLGHGVPLPSTRAA